MRSFALLFALAACTSAPADDGDFVSTDIPVDTDGPKADGPSLEFTPVEGLSVRASIGMTEEGRVIRSAGAFKTAFGSQPAPVDFDDEWLAVYSGGVQRPGGYAASIERISLPDSGKS